MPSYDLARLASIQGQADDAEAELDAARQARDKASERLTDARNHRQALARSLEPQPQRRRVGESDAAREAREAEERKQAKRKAAADAEIAALERQVATAKDRLEAASARLMPAIELARKCRDFAKGPRYAA